MKKPTLFTALALALTVPSLAREGQSEGGLERARQLFEKVDLDGDGAISAREAGRSQIPSRDFVANDTDRDRSLSGDEFVVFYRGLLVRAGKEVDADLEAETSRIQSARRAREAEEAKRKEGQPPVTPPPADQTGGDSDAERAEAARKQAAEEAARRAQEARDKQAEQDAARAAAAREQLEQERAQAAREQKAAENAKRAQDARDQKAEEDAARIAAAREQQAAQDAARAKAVRDQLAQRDAQRAADARKAGQGGEVQRVATARQKAVQERPGGGAPQTPEQRAAAYVQRLVAGGRLTAAQARDFYAVLLTPPAEQGGDASKVDVAALRAAVKRAKGRIGPLVLQGDLSAEEGRQLSTTMDERAKALLDAAGAGDEEGGDDPPARQRGQRGDAPPKTTGDRPKAEGRPKAGGRGAPGTGRTTDPKPVGTVRPGGRGGGRG